MLKELLIKNFAIIDDLNIHFEDGLTILSGGDRCRKIDYYQRGQPSFRGPRQCQDDSRRPRQRRAVGLFRRARRFRRRRGHASETSTNPMTAYWSAG